MAEEKRPLERVDGINLSDLISQIEEEIKKAQAAMKKEEERINKAKEFMKLSGILRRLRQQ